jgi:YbbR domain-containing protein
VDTEPLSVAGITDDFSRGIDLMAPGSGVRLESDEVTAKVVLAQVVTHKEFHDVPIGVRDTDLKFRMDTRHVNLDLSGPLLTLEKIDLKTAVSVEAAGLAPGTYSVPVQINLPEGVALVRQAPEKVKLRVYREKQGNPD